MSEKIFHSHIEKVPEKEADIYGQAASELGNFAVKVIAEPGQSYIGNNKKPHSVAEGMRAVRISGTFGPEGSEAFYDKVSEIHARQTQEKIGELEQAFASPSAFDPNIKDNQ